MPCVGMSFGRVEPRTGSIASRALNNGSILSTWARNFLSKDSSYVPLAALLCSPLGHLSLSAQPQELDQSKFFKISSSFSASLETFFHIAVTAASIASDE